MDTDYLYGDDSEVIAPNQVHTIRLVLENVTGPAETCCALKYIFYLLKIIFNQLKIN